MHHNATTGDGKAGIMLRYLELIADLPLEFNTRARALAQEALAEIGHKREYRDNLTAEQRDKVLRRSYVVGGTPYLPPKENTIDQEKEKPKMSENQNSGTPAPYIPPSIDMIPVESSNVAAFGHNGGDILRVEFKNGSAYDYHGITGDEFIDLVNADSPGKAYNALVKGKDRGIKLDQGAAA